MTQHSHSPSNADRLNTLLDALVSGKRVPDAAVTDLDAYAATHRLVSGDAATGASATPAEDTLDDIWRTIMQVPASIPAPTDDMRRPVSARQKARLNAVPSQPRPSRFQSLASIATVAAMLVVLIGAAWFSGGGRPDIPESARYAAVPLESGTPVSDAFTVESWMIPVDPSECAAEPMTSSEYADKVRRSPEPPERSYDITGEADPDLARDAVAVAREYNACDLLMDANRTRSLSTARFLLPSTRFWAAPDSDYPPDWRTSPEGEFIAHFSYALPPSAWALIFDEGAPEYVQEVWDRNVLAQSTPVVPPVGMENKDTRYFHDMPYGIPAYNPARAQVLADGRIALPMTRMYWWDDPNLKSAADVFESPDQRLIVILSDIEGEWRVDEWVYLCFGECELPPDADASPVATPESALSLPAATYVHPNPAMCTVEPLTVDEVIAIVTDEALATPGVLSPMPVLDYETYEELRYLLQQYLACEIAGDPFRVWAISSPDATRSRLTISPGWATESQLRTMLEEMQAEVDAAPDMSAFEWAPAGNPVIPAMPKTYDRDFFTFDDERRLRVTVVWVTRDGGPPSEEYGYPIGAEDGVSEMIFVWDANQGRWLIDGFAQPDE